MGVSGWDDSPWARLLMEVDAIERHEDADLVVWLLCGVALIVTWMQHGGVVEALDTAAKAWLGVAVTATHSYFGIKEPAPSKPGEGGGME